jgi:general secretion pathway protein L
VELLLQILHDLGVQRISILPSQTTLPLVTEKYSASLQDKDSTLNLRLSEHEGMGLTLDPAAELLSTLRTLIPTAPLVLFFDSAQQSKYATELAADSGITIQTLNGTHFQMPDQSLDLAAGVATGHQNTWDWRPWRWPLILGAALLLTQTLALNLDWWHLSREARDLRTSMMQIYLSAYPKETVFLDPLLQMQQKIATTRRETGLSSPDDFNSLVAELGTVWSNTPPPTSITAIEYHNHKLNVTLKDKVAIETIKAQLAPRSVTIETSPDADHTWIIGSKR